LDVGGTEQTHLLTSEEQSLSSQLLHLMTTDGSSVEGLDLPSEVSHPDASSGAPRRDVMASLLSSPTGNRTVVASTATTPLPRFTQAFQSQQQQQQQQHHHHHHHHHHHPQQQSQHQQLPSQQQQEQR